MAYDQITTERTGAVARITLNRPERLNALTQVMSDELVDAFTKAREDQEVRAVLLTGLEMPFGYVIAEPGGVERILPGVYAAEELIEEVQVYFDLEDDTTVSPEPKVITE